MAAKQYGMALKDFVEGALTGIAQGVKAANQVEGQNFMITGQKGVESSYIDFDIAVSTKSAKRGGVQIVVLGMGAGGSARKETEQVSRIQFKVLYRMKS